MAVERCRLANWAYLLAISKFIGPPVVWLDALPILATSYSKPSGSTIWARDSLPVTGLRIGSPVISTYPGIVRRPLRPSTSTSKWIGATTGSCMVSIVRGEDGEHRRERVGVLAGHDLEQRLALPLVGAFVDERERFSVPFMDRARPFEQRGNRQPIEPRVAMAPRVDLDRRPRRGNDPCREAR